MAQRLVMRDDDSGAESETSEVTEASEEAAQALDASEEVDLDELESYGDDNRRVAIDIDASCEQARVCGCTAALTGRLRRAQCPGVAAFGGLGSGRGCVSGSTSRVSGKPNHHVHR